MIESAGFNNTLAPYMTVGRNLLFATHICLPRQCANDNDKIYGEAAKKLAKWDAVFLKDAQKRLQGMMKGYEFSLRDAKDFVSNRLFSFSGLERRRSVDNLIDIPADGHMCIRNCRPWLFLVLWSVHGEGVERLRI